MQTNKQEILELRIVAGLHQGAVLTLLDETVEIGCDPSCDIVLLDEGVQGHHLFLRRESGGWRMEPQGELMPMNIAFPIGQAAVMLCLRGGDWAEPASAQTVPAAAAAAAAAAAVVAEPVRSRKIFHLSLLGVFLLTVLGSIWFFAPRQSLGQPSFEKLPEPKLSASLSPSLNPSKENFLNTQQQLELLTQLLRDRSLKDLVEVQITPGHINLKADLNKLEMKRLEEVIPIFKKRLDPKTIVNSDIHAIEKKLPFEINEVVLGPASFIKLKTGQTVHVGETVEGVLLVAIRPGVLEFSSTRYFEVAW